MDMHFAPLQGYTDDTYLSCHNKIYGGGYTCYTPFIRIEKGQPRHQDMIRYKRAADSGLYIVPQVIFRSVDEFTVLAQALKAVGAVRIDLNLGCPYPMQTRKGRGAAMISDLGVMAEVSRIIADDADVSYSVKMRLGLESRDEWKGLMPVLNATPLSYVTMHPRLASQLYGGDLYLDSFAEFVSMSVHPVVYNGDILSREDIDRVSTGFPNLKGVMIGRGMLARPSLIKEWTDGGDMHETGRMAMLRDFHDMVLARYEEILCGEAQILQKIKPFWDFMDDAIGHKCSKSIKKASSLAKYRNAVESIFMFS